MEILKEEKQEKLKSSTKLLDFVRLFRYMPIVAIAGSVIVLSLQLFLTLPIEPPYSSQVIVLLLLIVIVTLSMGTFWLRRRVPARPMPCLLPPRAPMSLEEIVLKELMKEGAKAIIREFALTGANVTHHPDLVFQMNGRMYIAEIKARPLVPSDIDNASRVLEDIKSRVPEMYGVLLFTSKSPPASVLEMATSRNVGIRVLSKLSNTK